MNIKEMHYDFLVKFNKLDSQKNENFLVPEIDWFLNTGLRLYINKKTAFLKEPYPISEGRRNLEDIKELVVYSHQLSITNNLVTLPEDYETLIEGEVIMNKSCCSENKKGKLIIQNYYTNREISPFNNSSFEWREVNGTFQKNGLQLYDDGTFTNVSCNLTYVKKHPYMHNAEDFDTNGYTSGDNHYRGIQNCLLSEETHRDIVDLAVFFAQSTIQNDNIAPIINLK